MNEVFETFGRFSIFIVCMYLIQNDIIFNTNLIKIVIICLIGIWVLLPLIKKREAKKDEKDKLRKWRKKDGRIHKHRR